MSRTDIRLARIAKAAKDTGNYPVQQIEYLGGTSNAMMLFPYGIHANLPPDAVALLFSIAGNAENKIAMGYTPTIRPELESGEVAFYLPGTTTIIKLSANGDIGITSDSAVNVTAPEITANGNLTVTGNLTVDGDTELGAIVTSNGKDISGTHTHVGSPTAAVGAVSPTGIPN